MKIVETIKKVCLTILGIIFFVFALCMTILLLYRNDYGVTEIDGTSLVIINSSITSEKYTKGDLVLVDFVKIENLSVGDEVFTYSIDENNVPHVTLGIIGEVYVEEDQIAFENGSGFSSESILGKSTKVYNNVGTFLSIVQSQWGFLFLVLVPAFLIFIYEVYALIIEIKYGEPE